LGDKKHILVVGSPSVHTINFIKLIQSDQVVISFLGEEKIDLPNIQSQTIVDVRSKKGMLLGKGKVKKAIEQINPDSIHIQQINRLGYFAAKAGVKLTIPYVATAWGSDVLLVPSKSKVHYNITKFVLDHATCATGDSQDMLDAMNKISPNTITELVNFGIDFNTKVQEKENIIYSNRLHNPLYRIDEIINGFHRFIKSNPDWKLIIAGSGSETELLKQQVLDLGLDKQVSFAGWLSTEKNWEYYHKARIYASIPESDGTAVSLLEAMYAGCIPVVRDLPVAREWITNNENGVIVQDMSIDFFQKAKNLINQELVENNRKLIVDKANRETNATRFLNLHL
jgi:glycosyltransferase involved in cell wall biosynthesis